MTEAITNRISRARWNADLRAQTELEDAQREKFMKTFNAGKIPMTEFEMAFVENWASTPTSKQWWTPRRREVADELKRKYGH